MESTVNFDNQCNWLNSNNPNINISGQSLNERRVKTIQKFLQTEGLEDEFMFTYTISDVMELGFKEFVEISLMGGKEILALFVYLDPSTLKVDVHTAKYITTTHKDLCKTIQSNTDGDYILASIRHINESILNKPFNEIMEMFGIDLIPNENFNG